jgi:hypothetical protein
VKEPRARRSPLEGGMSPRARRNPLEGAQALERGGSCSRGRLIGPLWWAAGATAVWAAPCVRRLGVCFVLFFAGSKQDSPGFLGGPQGCPRHIAL